MEDPENFTDPVKTKQNIEVLYCWALSFFVS